MGKISEFTKEEVRNELNTSGQMHRLDPSSRLWQRARDLYMHERGEELDLGCGKCFNKLAEWVKR